MNECKPLPAALCRPGALAALDKLAAADQGLTLAHFSAQLERFFMEKGVRVGVV
jgi:hypothetical protein